MRSTSPRYRFPRRRNQRQCSTYKSGIPVQTNRATSEIAAAGYDLSINRYKEVVHEVQEHRAPKEIIVELKVLEEEIALGLAELEAML